MVHSAGDCGFGRRDGLITQRKTEAGNIKQEHKGYNTVIFKFGVSKVPAHSKHQAKRSCKGARTLTRVARCSGVAGPIASAAEAIPCLFTPAAVFTVIRHAPAKGMTF